MDVFQGLVQHVWLRDILVFLIICLLSIRMRLLDRVEEGLARFAENRRTVLAALFLGPMLLRLALLPLLPAPRPVIHDEFSYLLMADTFSHGRLTNPPHPMWKSFETFHVIWSPTYASKYPPAQGLVLALGELLGNPWIGVVLSAGAMCAGISWALLPWMPSRWAALAALLAAIKLGVATYWINSYWGGTVAAVGGALVIGATGRLVKRARFRDGVLMGLGMAILACSRPLEGLLLCLPVTWLLLRWVVDGTKSHEVLRKRATAVAPIAAILVMTVLSMGYYNWRVTGNALLPPYLLSTETRDSSALFIWQRAKPVVHTGVKAFDDFAQWERAHYNRTWHDLAQVSYEKLQLSGSVFGWPEALVAGFGALFLFRDRRVRFLSIVFVAVVLGHFVCAWSNPHYIAPITCIVYGLIVQSFRHLRSMRCKGLSLGVIATRFAVATLVINIAVLAANGLSDSRGWGGPGLPGRAEVERELDAIPGKHIVLVRYLRNHSFHQDWVYNKADIDGSNIIWARELDAAQNEKLIDYFRDRSAWLAQVSFFGAHLEPYPADDHRIPNKPNPRTASLN